MEADKIVPEGIQEPGFFKEQEVKKFRTLTIEDQTLINKETEYKSGLIIRAIRMIRDNPDLIVLSLIVIACCAFGYWVARIKLGLTTDQIKIQIWDFIEFIGIVLVGVSAVVGKLFMTQGTITRALSGQAKKDADVTGNTMKPRVR
jgi:hypothetical protein